MEKKTNDTQRLIDMLNIIQKYRSDAFQLKFKLYSFIEIT